MGSGFMPKVRRLRGAGPIQPRHLGCVLHAEQRTCDKGREGSEENTWHGACESVARKLDCHSTQIEPYKGQGDLVSIPIDPDQP